MVRVRSNCGAHAEDAAQAPQAKDRAENKAAKRSQALINPSNVIFLEVDHVARFEVGMSNLVPLKSAYPTDEL